MKPYACYLFDADGTLIDTVDLIYRCFVHGLGVHSQRTVTRAEVESLVGLTLRAQYERYLGPLSDQQYAVIRDTHMGYQMRIHRDHVKAFPGVAAELSRLHAAGRRLGVVSSRLRETLTLYLGETGLAPYFQTVVTPEDTQRHKPDPQPVLLALQRLQVLPGDALMVGDAAWDVECAAAAGVDSALVSWSRSDPSLMTVKPTYCIAGLGELL